jgi:hypothetical protein
MHVGGQIGSWMQTVNILGPVSVPSVMHFISAAAAPAEPSQAAAPDQQGAIAGHLLLGSLVSNSQTIDVPADSWAHLTRGTRPPSPLSWALSDAALVKSLAPVHSCVLVPGSRGAGDASLLVASGVAPCGRLSRARLGATLSPYLVDGPSVPVSDLPPCYSNGSSVHY